MLARIAKVCTLAIIFAVVGTACKSTKPRVSAANDTIPTHVVADRQFDDRSK